MAIFSLLTNKNRAYRRPPRLVRIANTQDITHLFPVRGQRRNGIPRSISGGVVDDAQEQAKGEPKSPLSQPPVIVHFPTIPRQSNGLVNNGRLRYPSNAKQISSPAVETKPVAPALLDEDAGEISPVVKPHESAMKLQQALDTGDPQNIVDEGQRSGDQNLGKKKPEDRIPETQPVPVTSRVLLRDLLAQNPALPPQAVVLGICEDGLPLALDLNDPSPGSLLVMGDERKDQIGLLRTAMASLGLRNSASAIQILLISHQPETWQAWIAQNGFQRHCIAIENSQEEDGLRNRIIQMADWTEQRRMGQRSGPPLLLVIDTLTFLPHLAYDIRLNFDWLVKEGPPARVWPIAAISTDLAASLGSRMLRAFRSRILGYAKEPEMFLRQLGLDEALVGDLRRPGQFTVQAGESWLQFHLPGDGI
jgi:hypothetical protein